MTNQELFWELGQLNPDLIAEAAVMPKAAKRQPWLLRIGAAAACVAVLWVGFVAFGGLGPKGTDDSLIQQPGMAQYTLNWNKGEGQTASDFYIPGHFWHEVTAAQQVALLPTIAEQYRMSGTTHYRGDSSVFVVDMQGISPDGAEFSIEMALGKVPQCCIVVTTPVYSDVLGVQVEAKYFKGNTDTLYQAEFQMEGIGYFMEMAGGQTEKDFFQGLIGQVIAGGAADFTALENPVVPQLRDDKLTLQQACEDGDFGQYVPKTIPTGFAFSNAQRFINQEWDYLYAYWNKDMEEISWQISRLTKAHKARITAVSDTKNYDLTLYPIPRADTVPRELWDIVDNPIFRVEELTLAVVEARAYTLGEKGDTAGTRMEFSVLLPGDIVIAIRAKGASIQDMLAMVGSIQP